MPEGDLNLTLTCLRLGLGWTCGLEALAARFGEGRAAEGVNRGLKASLRHPKPNPTYPYLTPPNPT